MCVSDSFGTGWSVQISRDRVSFCRDLVSISSGVLKPSHVSILSRLCVDFALCSLEFGSNLKNLHRGEKCRERAKTGDRVF